MLPSMALYLRPKGQIEVKWSHTADGRLILVALNRVLIAENDTEWVYKRRAHQQRACKPHPSRDRTIPEIDVSERAEVLD